jgi:hypothetical protein
MSGKLFGIGLALASPAGMALASLTYDFQMTPSSNISITEGQADVNTSGTLIGDYDPVANPSGTRTKPGLFSIFGPTENLPVPVTVDATAAGAPVVPASGSFRLSLDTAAGTVLMSDYDSYMAGPASSGMDVSALFHPQEAFRTRNPDSTYLAVGIPVSLGTATLTSFNILQTATAVGTLTATGPDLFDFEVVVPVDLVVEFELMGSQIIFGPEPGLLPLSGSIARSGATAQLTSLAPLNLSQTEYPAEPLETIPFGLPTLSGDTANVLLDLVVDQLTILMLGELDTSADGTVVPPSIAGDANMDGWVDIADLGILAANWQLTGRSWEQADFNYDGIVDIADLGMLAANWQTGAGDETPLFSQALEMFDLFDRVEIPEPTGISLLGLVGLLALRRRGTARYRAACG